MPRLPNLATASLALVGNAPEMVDHAQAIDAAECVVRFNNAPGFGTFAGSRVTHLALVNRGGQARAWAEEAGFVERPVVRKASNYVLPFPELSPAEDGVDERMCWTDSLRSKLGDRPVWILTEALHAEACRLLSPDVRGIPNPSTGFLVALAVLRKRAPAAPPVDVYGFGFAGWSGHPWVAERRWFETSDRDGHLRITAHQLYKLYY